MRRLHSSLVCPILDDLSDFGLDALGSSSGPAEAGHVGDKLKEKTKGCERKSVLVVPGGMGSSNGEAETNLWQDGSGQGESDGEEQRLVDRVGLEREKKKTKAGRVSGPLRE